MKVNSVGALEAHLFQGRNDTVEITFDDDEHCFVATLLEEYEPEEGEDETELEDVFYTRELVRASGQTIVEALLELELVYREHLGVQ